MTGLGGVYRSAEGRERLRAWCETRLSAWDVPHTTRFLETRLGAVHLLEAGEGPTSVVYLPGTNFTSASSLGFLTELSRRCRVVSLDLPGQPGLSTPTRPTGGDRDTGWLSDVMTSLRREPGSTVLVGHSRGAHTALCSDPSAVDALVLVNPAGLVKVALSFAMLRAATGWALRPSERRSHALLQVMSGRGHAPSPEQVAWLTLVARETRTTGAPGPVPAPVLDRWRTVRTLVVAGEQDCFFPPARLEPVIRDRLGIGLALLPGVGHLSVEEAPQLVAQQVLGVGDASSA